MLIKIAEDLAAGDSSQTDQSSTSSAGDIVKIITGPGADTSVYKQAYQGPTAFGVFLKPLDANQVFDKIKFVLKNKDFDPSKQYTPEQTQEFIKDVRSALSSEYSGYLSALNPQLANVEL